MNILPHLAILAGPLLLLLLLLRLLLHAPLPALLHLRSEYLQAETLNALVHLVSCNLPHPACEGASSPASVEAAFLFEPVYPHGLLRGVLGLVQIAAYGQAAHGKGHMAIDHLAHAIHPLPPESEVGMVLVGVGGVGAPVRERAILLVHVRGVPGRLLVMSRIERILLLDALRQDIEESLRLLLVGDVVEGLMEEDAHGVVVGGLENND